MANLYLVNKALAHGLAIAGRDPQAQVVLLQDGVYLDPSPAHAAGAQVYAVKADVERRGLAASLPAFVQVIDYGQLVDLVVAHKVVNFA